MRARAAARRGSGLSSRDHPLVSDPSRSDVSLRGKESRETASWCGAARGEAREGRRGTGADPDASPRTGEPAPRRCLRGAPSPAVRGTASRMDLFRPRQGSASPPPGTRRACPWMPLRVLEKQRGGRRVIISELAPGRMRVSSQPACRRAGLAWGLVVTDPVLGSGHEARNLRSRFGAIRRTHPRRGSRTCRPRWGPGAAAPRGSNPEGWGTAGRGCRLGSWGVDHGGALQARPASGRPSAPKPPPPVMGPQSRPVPMARWCASRW